MVNPRSRDQVKFEAIVESIRRLGLKKPIQVREVDGNLEAERRYELVCGQGRLEACIALGYASIPAVIVTISSQDGLLRSLVENIARVPPRKADLLAEIETLKGRGYSHSEISLKLDVPEGTISGLILLKSRGEERLLTAVLNDKISLSIAVEIAKADTPEGQRALLEAYETAGLSRKALRAVRKMADQRELFGKGETARQFSRDGGINAKELINSYRRESEKQRIFVRKAELCQAKLDFVVHAFGRLLEDATFRSLIEEQKLNNIPAWLARTTEELKGK